MTYSNKVERTDPKILKAELCLASAHAVDAVSKNPSLAEKDEFGGSFVQGYYEVNDFPNTIDVDELAEYKLGKICEGVSTLLEIGSRNWLDSDLETRLAELYDDYLEAYPMITEEVSFYYMKNVQSSSDYICAMKIAAELKENVIIDKGRKPAYLRRVETDPLPWDAAKRMMRENVDELLLRKTKTGGN